MTQELNDQKIFDENISKKPTELFSYVQRQLITRALNIEQDLEEINKKVASEIKINRDDFKLLGLLSYWVGIGYCNQTTITEKIIKPISERFKKLNFSEKSASLFVGILRKVQPENIEELKAQMLTAFVDETIVIPKECLNHINNIVNNSIVDTKLIVDIRKIIAGPFTYQDVLKINGIISKQSKFIDVIALRAYINLFSSPEFAKLFNAALAEFDNQKYSIIYLDGIFSIKETFERFSPKVLERIIMGTYEIPAEEIIESKSTEEKSAEEKAEIERINKENTDIPAEKSVEELAEIDRIDKENAQVMTNEEIKNLMENNPVKFLFNFLADSVAKESFENTDNVIFAIDNMFTNEDLMQHVYKYIKSNVQKLRSKNASDLLTEVPETVEIEMLIDAIKLKIEPLREQIKTTTETLCKEIPVNELEKIVPYIKAVISDLIISTDEEKQYLVSQYLENGIKTYKHLQQILKVIENTEMIGKNSKSFIVLDSYIKGLTDVKSIFEESYTIDAMQNKYSVYYALLDFFEPIVANSPTETSEKIN